MMRGQLLQLTFPYEHSLKLFRGKGCLGSVYAIKMESNTVHILTSDHPIF